MTINPKQLEEDAQRLGIKVKVWGPYPLEDAINIVAKEAFGMTPAEARAKGVCISCGEPITGEFRDDQSAREADLTQLCQKCQDAIDILFEE